MFDILPWMQLTATVPLLPFGIVGSYLVAVRLGLQAMKDRPAFDLQAPLTAWNALLAIFSAIGFTQTAPTALRAAVCASEGCALAFRHGAPALWTTLFMLSKTPELLDTAFLILRKKQVSFLHVYHHSTVLVYCWLAFSLESPLGIYFASMNYGVHAVMYTYYLFSGPLKRFAPVVTMLQIAQMSAGVCIAVMGSGCEPPLSLMAAKVLYASYLVLFVRLYTKKF